MTRLARASVRATASPQDAKTGTPATGSRLPDAATPPTTRVPYACINCAWVRPARPVMPWMITGTVGANSELSTMRAFAGEHGYGQFHRPFEVGFHRHRKAGIGKNP